MDKEKIPISVWKRYEAYDLEIVPNLASASHAFNYDGHNVEIKLPKRPQQKDWHKENSPITCWSYRAKGNRKYPSSFRVHQIDATIDTKNKRIIRKDAIGIVNVGLFNNRERSSFDKLTYRYERILDAAFEYWVNVLRWCTAQPTICQLSHQRQDTMSGAYLIHSGIKKRFYCPPHVITVEADKPINKVEWNRARKILTDGRSVPIWQIYYAEAYERLNIGDMRGFIISLAISSETIVRHLTKSFLKEPVNEKYQSIVNTIPISRLINNWKKLGFDSKDWKKLEQERKSISNLFEMRNGIMHRGEDPDISKKLQMEFGVAVKKFLELGEKYG